ncbi:MAG: hypothetical protein KOO62_13675, partial [candidate division Zixibacteria bacterium]|nr:hypothetical protein [candidate division Zixibacteria bacterium]
MTRKSTSLFILILLTVAMLAVSADASRSTDLSFDKVKAYGFSFQESENQFQAFNRGSNQTSLGTHTADGNSPGYIVGRSFEDRPNWYHPGRTVDWRNDPIIHFIYAFQGVGGPDYDVSPQSAMYDYFNPLVGTQGAWGPTPLLMYGDPINTHGIMPQLAVDTTGHAMPATYWRTPVVTDDISNCEIFWDVAGPGAWGTMLGDTLPASISEDPTVTQGYPKIELQHYAGQIITHVVAVEFIGPTCGYWRRVGDNPTPGPWTYQRITQAMNWSGEMTVAASTMNGDVAVVFMTNDGDDCDNVAYVESTDGGASWPDLTPITIINVDLEGSAWVPWCNVDALYDTDGYLHIVYNTMEVVGCVSQGIDPARLYHWTDRVSGDNAGGKLSLVAVADFHGLGSMCGRAGTNVANLAKGAISQCDTNLVVIWQQFGDPDAGDSLDCPVDNVWTGGYNTEIYMSVSSTLDGGAWDAGRNLTNSHNPDCDSTAANNCDHDNYASPSRYAMDMSLYDTTKWAAVPEAFQVRDVLAPGQGDTQGWYIDVAYVDDLYAGVARWRDDAPVWTYNPIKWFRLPCVDPIIKPQINCSHPDFLAPTNWVKTGTPTVIEDVTILNIGNADLIVGTIAANVTVGDPSWVTITGTPGTIGIGGEGYFDVNLNPGGIVTTQTALEAEITIASNDPDRPLITAFEIATVIADTVVQVIWDTVNNASNFALTCANQGQLGHSGWGNVNMDFVHTDSSGPECTLTDEDYATEHVYLYDACPVMMIDDSEAFGTYAWNPFWVPARSSEHDFRPIPGTGPSKSTGDDYMEHVSDVFVTPDTSIQLLKHTYIVDGNSFVVEGYKIVADATTDMYFGEWIDWDVPTLGTGNQGGTVAAPGGV